MTAQEKKEKLKKEALEREYNEQIEKENKLKYSDVYYDGSLSDGDYYSVYDRALTKPSLGMFVKMINEEMEFIKKGFPKFSFTQIIIIALAYHIIDAIESNS